MFSLGNGYGNTALHEACRMGYAATINTLLEHGADVNAKNHKGSTPLHMFCYGNPKAGKIRRTQLWFGLYLIHMIIWSYFHANCVMANRNICVLNFLTCTNFYGLLYR